MHYASGADRVALLALHLIRAAMAGSGKSFLVNLAHVILSGRFCPAITAGETSPAAHVVTGAAHAVAAKAAAAAEATLGHSIRNGRKRHRAGCERHKCDAHHAFDGR